ncbi:MAG: DUF5076 domain-containing protein [Acidobacteria bacterium 13_1_40CM_2_60_7]|nr:MAG: DUF5076 domain-containing protein [Acidobacteria bacterium 13_1_40CM_4_61_5]OLD62827.1 MAG: DUF5076 domain-containing protein [Acidobacteria bacterium 13_1_40CM_2_60_7]PYU04389.1 MAG: DUF5076 domain-containing protein [Acidobacteriota bacterium]
MGQKDQLMIPDVARQDGKSFEVLRVWIAQKGQHVSLRTGVWEDPFAWGIMLADLAGHIANSFAQSARLDRQEVLQKIRMGFDVEMNSPTDTPTGSIM